MTRMRMFSKINTESYIQALQSPKLDSSDFILLATKILENMLGDKVKDELAKIKTQYAKNENAAAIEGILEIVNQQTKNEALPSAAVLKLMAEKAKSFSDNPLENQSRRFFETILAESSWDALESSEFASIEKLSPLMSRINPKFQPTSVVNSLASAGSVIGMIRDFGENTPVIFDGMSQLRDASELSKSKDRGETRINAKAGEKLYSQNPGILKASDPMPRDHLLEQTAVNRIPDMFNLAQKPGYSAQHKETPYVNSVSGTTFVLVTVLKHFMDDQNPTTPEGRRQLDQDVNNIIKSFVPFMCKKGYHSLSEMIDVLKSPEVQKIFTDHGVKVNLDIFTQPIVDKACAAASDHARTLCLQRSVQAEIKAVPRS